MKTVTLIAGPEGLTLAALDFADDSLAMGRKIVAKANGRPDQYTAARRIVARRALEDAAQQLKCAIALLGEDVR